jgi:hypothetical protein
MEKSRLGSTPTFKVLELCDFNYLMFSLRALFLPTVDRVQDFSKLFMDDSCRTHINTFGKTLADLGSRIKPYALRSVTIISVIENKK